MEAKFNSPFSRFDSTAHTAFPFGQAGKGGGLAWGLRRLEHHVCAGGKLLNGRNCAYGDAEQIGAAAAGTGAGAITVVFRGTF